MAKRPIGSPKAADLPFVPAAKRRTNIGGKDVMRSNADLKAPGFPLRPNPGLFASVEQVIDALVVLSIMTIANGYSLSPTLSYPLATTPTMITIHFAT